MVVLRLILESTFILNSFFLLLNLLFDSNFLQLAVRAAGDSKATSAPTVSVELPQSQTQPPAKSSSGSFSNGDSTTPPSLQTVSLESPILPRLMQARIERVGAEQSTTAARIDPSYFERAMNEQQKLSAGAATPIEKVTRPASHSSPLSSFLLLVLLTFPLRNLLSTSSFLRHPLLPRRHQHAH